MSDRTWSSAAVSFTTGVVASTFAVNSWDAGDEGGAADSSWADDARSCDEPGGASRMGSQARRAGRQPCTLLPSERPSNGHYLARWRWRSRTHSSVPMRRIRLLDPRRKEAWL